jgi:hypothetical protein
MQPVAYVAALRDSIAGGHPIIISEAAPISHDKDAEYCLLSEGRHPAYKKPQKKIQYSLSLPPPPRPAGGGFIYATACNPHFHPKLYFRTHVTISHTCIISRGTSLAHHQYQF